MRKILPAICLIVMALASAETVGQEIDFEIFNGALRLIGNSESNELSVDCTRPLTSNSSEVKIPTSIKFLGKDYYYSKVAFFTFGNEVTAYSVEDDNPYYTTVDGIVYSRDIKKLIACPKGKEGKVEIPEGVEEIGMSAFDGCSKITEVTIPNTVIKIGICAFDYMANLTELHIPASVTMIDDIISISLGCPRLKQITVSEANPMFTAVDGNLYSKDRTQLISWAGGKKGDVQIPEGVKSMSICIFDTNPNITSLTIPSTLRKIAHEGIKCDNLTSVTIAEGADSITFQFAFNNCKNLTRVVIPASIRHININEFETFTRCPNLRFEVDVNNQNYESMDGKLYKKKRKRSRKKELVFECVQQPQMPTYDTLQYSYFFFGPSWDIKHKTLTRYPTEAQGEFSIPSDVEAIARGAFINCKGLTSLTIGKSVKSIDASYWQYYADYVYPFKGCDNLTSVTIKRKTPPSSYDSFPTYFVVDDYEKATELTDFTYFIVEGTRKAYFAQKYCFDFPFYGANKNLTIYIPKGSREIYEALWGKRNFVEIDMPDAGE